MKKDYTTITIKVNGFTLEDVPSIRQLAFKHCVPERASVRIVTSGLGTHITFEWAELSDKETIEKYGYKHYVAQSGRTSDWRNHYKK